MSLYLEFRSEPGIGSKCPTRWRSETETVVPSMEEKTKLNCVSRICQRRLQCGFERIENLGKFFRGSNQKKGEKLWQHVFSLQEIIDGPTNEVKAKYVSQVRSNVVHNITLQVSGVSLHFALE